MIVIRKVLAQVSIILCDAYMYLFVRIVVQCFYAVYYKSGKACVGVKFTEQYNYSCMYNVHTYNSHQISKYLHN